MDDQYFRHIDGPEANAFREWAKDQFQPNVEPNPLWHPIVRATWEQLQAEWEEGQAAFNDRFCPKCGNAFAVHDNGCPEDTQPFPWIGNRAGNLLIVVKSGSIEEAFWITGETYQLPPTVTIRNLDQTDDEIEAAYEQDMADIERCEEYDFGIKVEKIA